MKSSLNKISALAMVSIVGGLLSVAKSTEATAATDVKPKLNVAGKSYYKKQTAKNSAVGRWEKKAVIKHGFKYGKWEKARKTSFDCDSKFHQGNGKKLWTCNAIGKPVAEVTMCTSGKIKAVWHHPNESGAKAGVRDAWEKLAAGHHGVKYSFYKNAKGKHSTCGADSRWPGHITCTLKATPCK